MKNRILKYGVLAAAVTLSAAMLAGCGQEADSKKFVTVVEETIVKESSQEPAPESTEEEPAEEQPQTLKAIGERVVVDGKMQSYLTGEWKDEEVVKRRSMAVMIPNNTPALPQYGISLASIVYEAPVEGRFTRLMGIFEDYDELEYIGPIRSSRDYYIREAMSFDSIYVNWGLARPWVEELINSDKIDNVSQAVAGIYNGASEAFDRISRPGYATEFTGYLMIDGYNKAVKRLGYETEYTDRYEQGFQFAADGCKATYDDYPEVSFIYPGGRVKNTGGYGNYEENNVRFEYNQEDGLYYRYQYGEPHIDEYNGEQIKVTNVVLKSCYGFERQPDDPAHDYLGFDCYGDGKAFIFTNGKAIVGTWHRDRDNEHAPTRYYDDRGDEIILNQGKTWLCNIWAQYDGYVSYY